MNANSYSKEKIISGLEYMYNKNIEYDEELESLSNNYSLQILWKFNDVVENGFFSLEINHFTKHYNQKYISHFKPRNVFFIMYDQPYIKIGNTGDVITSDFLCMLNYDDVEKFKNFLKLSVFL